MDWIARTYFSFDGRIGRGHWWAAWVLLLAVEVAFNAVISPLMGDDIPFPDGSWSSIVDMAADKSGALTALIFLYPNLAMNVKRLHDRNLSGWYTLVFIIPFVAATAISAVADRAAPTPFEGWVTLISGFAALWFLANLGVLPGTQGANRYGVMPTTK
ncbi:MAG: DUF805 domain-containing protein [Hyphomicrobiales bacterium]|nr:DUF805 domain-containing protein [Hyphomicrobiales bacterium]